MPQAKTPLIARHSLWTENGAGIVMSFAALLGLSWFFCGVSEGDDTYIYMRYVKSYLTTGAFTFNPGEVSLGITSLLWPLVMLPVSALFGVDVYVWKLASSFAYALGGVAMFVSLRRLGFSTPRSLGLTLCLVLNVLALRWSGTGMDNGVADTITTLAICLLVLAAYDRDVNPQVLGVTLAVMPFARPELALLSMSITLFVVRTRGLVNSYTIRMIAAAVGTSLFFLLAAYLIIGDVFPQTLEAKSISGMETATTQKTLAVALVGSGVFGMSLGAFCLSRRSFGEKQWLLHVIVPLGLIILFLANHKIGISTRYETYLALPLLVSGIFCVGLHSRHTVRRVVVALQMLLAIGVAGYFWPATRTSDGEQIGSLIASLEASVPPDARIAAGEIGALGFYSSWYVIDLVGLVDRKSLDYLRVKGPPESGDELNEMLYRRGATHFIEKSSENLKDTMQEFECADRIPVASGRVMRKTLASAGETTNALWLALRRWFTGASEKNIIWIAYRMKYRHDSTAAGCTYLRSAPTL